MNIISPITLDKLIKKNELSLPFTLMDHQREVLRLAFINRDNTYWVSSLGLRAKGR